MILKTLNLVLHSFHYFYFCHNVSYAHLIIRESLTSHINGCGLRECEGKRSIKDIGVKRYLLENTFLGVPDLGGPGKTRRRTIGSYLEIRTLS